MGTTRLFVSLCATACVTFLLTRGLALTQPVPAPQDTSQVAPAPTATPMPPELLSTWTWLTGVLPTSTADATGGGREDKSDAEYAIYGCELDVSVGTWLRAAHSNTPVWPDLLNWTFLVRFEPRFGSYFDDRLMSDKEALAFQQRHSEGGQFMYGFVDTIDMSQASLSSFTVIGEEKVAYLPFVGVQGSGKYAYFRFDDESHANAVRRALVNAATICGATE